MLLLSCDKLTRGYDANPLFEDVSLEIFGGERIGLVGPNGAGKTTLLKVLSGRDQPDRGNVRLHAGARVDLLEQHPTFPVGRTLFEEAKSAFAEMLHAQEEMIRVGEQLAASTDESEHRALAATYERLHELLRHEDAYTLDHKVESVLNGLGFRSDDYDRPLESFSGGQQRRLLLGKLLLSAPDVMLLDEPSNHLDIGGVRWLEDYLVQQPQGMILVSHDRYFLNKVTTRIFELHQQQIRSFPGNFQQYLRLRQERYEQDLKAWESQKEYVEKQEEYIRRVHYGQLAKQAQSRRKALDRMERVERPTMIESPHMQFGDVVRAGDVVIEADRVSKGFDQPLFTDLSFAVKRGQRLGITGPNGCGKTTLLKILLGDVPPDSGAVRHGRLATFGYLDQHLQMLPDDQTVIRAVWPKPDPSITEQVMRDLLGRFGLIGDIVFQKVGELSGGERSRAALASLVVAGVNVLILDEPTNHLDIWACDALEQALLEYEGTVVVVSHDRYFLNRVVDLLIVFDNGQTQVVYGNYDTYERLRAEQLAAIDKKPVVGAKKATAPTPTSKRKRRFPYRKLEDLEADIHTAEQKKRDLEAALASTELYRNGEKVKEALQGLDDAKKQLMYLYEHWEETMEFSK